MNDPTTAKRIENYNLYAGTEIEPAVVSWLAFDPVNLPDFGAVIDLPFVRAKSASL